MRLGHLLLGATAATAGGFDFSFLERRFDEADADIYTFTSVDFGAAASDRTIAVVVSIRDAQMAISSITVGGVTATDAVTANDTNSDVVSIRYAEVPTGASGDVVVTTSGSTDATRCGVAVYRLTGTISVADTASSTANNGSLAVDAVAGDVVLAGVMSNAFADNVFTWTGATVDGTDNQHVSMASAVATGTETRSVSVSNSNDLNRISAAAVLRRS